MPTLTYPGVYIEELPSAVHTITGVATSIAAFVGWAPMGSVTEATLVQSWSDFQNQFGGLESAVKARLRRQPVLRQWRPAGLHRPLGLEYVVHGRIRHPNGGCDGERFGDWWCLHTPRQQPWAMGKRKCHESTLVGHRAERHRNDQHERFDRFSLTIQDLHGNTLESFANLSTDPHDAQGRYVVTVIDNDSPIRNFHRSDNSHDNSNTPECDTRQYGCASAVVWRSRRNAIKSGDRRQL